MGGVHAGSVKIRGMIAIDAGLAASAVISAVAPQKEEVDRPDRHFGVHDSRIVGGDYRCHQAGIAAAYYYHTCYSQMPWWKIPNHVIKLSGTLVTDTELIGFGSFDYVKTGYYPLDGKAYALDRCRTGHRNYAITLDAPPGHHMAEAPDHTPVVELRGVTTRFVADTSRMFFAEAPTSGIWGVARRSSAEHLLATKALRLHSYGLDAHCR